MQPLDSITLGQIITYGRDLSIAGVILKIGWEARGAIDSVKDFFANVGGFMTSVSTKLDTLNTNVNTVMTNHLHHIDEKLDLIASGKSANDKISAYHYERLASNSAVDLAGPGPSDTLQA